MVGMHTMIILIAKYAVVVPVGVLVYVFARLDKRRRIELVVFLGVSVVMAAVLAKLAAALHQDPRPFVRDGVRPYFVHGADNGFPSDHTTYSAAIAFVVLRYRWQLGLALAAVSLAIGTARVAAGVHHGQDVAAGFVIGAAGAGLGFAALKAAAVYRSRHERTAASGK